MAAADIHRQEYRGVPVIHDRRGSDLGAGDGGPAEELGNFHRIAGDFCLYEMPFGPIAVTNVEAEFHRFGPGTVSFPSSAG